MSFKNKASEKKKKPNFKYLNKFPEVLESDIIRVEDIDENEIN